MNWFERIRCCAYAAVCLAPVSYGQAFGHISGQVLDGSHAAIAGADITLQSAATGVTRKAITGSNGYYAIADIQIGSYSIRAEKTGFRTAVHEGVRIGVADSLTVNLVLSPGDVQDVITITGKVESDVAPGSRLDAAAIAHIPINGRDYARLCLIIPGATPRSASMADLPFNGLSPVLNSWAMDGVDASRVDIPYLVNGGERGARLLTGSLDTIAEFRIQTANYEAQYGRAASAYVNIASRSGSNEPHGGVFSYLRNDFLDARNFFNTRPSAQATLRYTDFGANLSGPIRRNKTFFFGNYEGSRQRVGITGSGTTASALLRAQVLAQSPVLAPIVAEFPQGTRATADLFADLYTTVSVSNVREDTGSIRIDQALSNRDTVFLRVNTNDSHVKGPLFAINPSALGLLDRQDVPFRTANVALHGQHVTSSRFLNETLLGMQRVAGRFNASTPYPLVLVPTLSITPGGGSDQKNISTSYQAGDDMSYIVGVHSLKWGGTVYRIQNDLRTSDTSKIFYASLDDFVTNTVSTANFMAGIPGRSVRAYQLGLYLQDSWRVRKNVTVDMGLRYDWEPTFFDPSHRSRPFDTRRQTLAPAGSAFYDGDRLNFGPRFGVGWRPRNRWSVRAGYGIYYEPYPVGYASPTIPLNGLPGNSSLLRQQVPALAYPVGPFPAPAAPAVNGFRWFHQDTDAEQWSLTTAFDATRDLTLQAAYVGNRGMNLRRRTNINLFDPVAQQRPNQVFSDILIEGNDARSDYNSLQLSARQRFHRDFAFGLNYTWAHAIDNAGDENPSSSQPQDLRNLKAERGNGSTDVRHIASFYSSYALPFGRNPHAGAALMSRLAGHWQIAASGVLRTGLATTVSIPLSQSGNGATASQRPDAVPGADPYAPHRSVDGWFNPAAFTLPLPGTFGNLGRNTVAGPGLMQMDVSAMKTTRIRDSASLEFRVECFNVLNHPNFAQPNAVLGNASFGKILNTLGRTLGVGTARQIQMALRLQF